MHVVRGRSGGLLQSSEGEAVMILLASVSSGILAIWPNRERRRAWTIADGVARLSVSPRHSARDGAEIWPLEIIQDGGLPPTWI